MFTGVNKSKRNLTVLCLLAVSIASVLVFVRPVSAQDTNVNAVICDSSPPNIEITSPVSDSTVNEPVVNLMATTERTTQVDISVNAIYTQSVALSLGQPINTQVYLQSGLNTITLAAYFSCNQTNADFNVVVSYDPTLTPSPGNQTSTQVLQPGNTTPFTVSNPLKNGSTETEPVLERIIDKLSGTDNNPGSRSVFDNSYVKVVSSWVLLLLSFVALFSLLAPAYFIGMISKALKLRINIESFVLRVILKIIAVCVVVISTLLLIS